MSARDQRYVGAIDQGTTGTRFMVFDHHGLPVSSAYREHRQLYPQPGWVEHDPEEIWANTLAVMRDALRQAEVHPRQLAAIGVTNQRETTVLWDAATGTSVHNAIVWQDRRTADRCRQLTREGWDERLRALTGLPPDPYFSATKIEWLLGRDPHLRARAERGEVLFGTIDSWLIWNLTGAHLTDVTNASRTMLFNLHTLQWDDELLALFGVPRAMLPTVTSSAEVYGMLDWRQCAELAQVWDGEPQGCQIPIAGNLGDQQAALFGQAGFLPDDIKNTYGTGSFLLRNTGETPVFSRHGLLTTVAYGLPGQSVRYALEGSIFITGAAVQWLRDGLELIHSAAETELLATSIPDNGGVYLVPAFSGLGAPYWNPYARGILVGLTRGTTGAHLVRAALEAIAYQTRDVLEAMTADTHSPHPITALKVDGGAVKNDFLCQFQSDVLGVPLMRPRVEETTALGAAYAAGLAVGFWSDLQEIQRLWKVDRVFEPRSSEQEREALYAGWQRAVRCALAWAADGE